MDEQEETRGMIRESAAAFVRDAGIRRARQLRFTERGYDPAVLRQMGELGWIGLRNADVGAGLGMPEACVLLEELGAGLVPEPIIAGMLAADVLTRDEQASVLDGGRVVIPAWQEQAGHLPGDFTTRFEAGRVTGVKRFVPMATGANDFLVATSQGWVLVSASDPAVHVKSTRTQDGGNFAEVRFEGPPGTLLGGNVARAIDEATLATAAYLLGVAREALAMTLTYLRERKQFGKAIGSFQVLQHRAVDLQVQFSLARASVNSAAASLEPAAISRAWLRATQAAMTICRSAVQMHGAIGYTDEYDVGLFLRKAITLCGMFGAPALHRRRFAEFLAKANDRIAEAAGEYSAIPNEQLAGMSDDEFRRHVRAWIHSVYPQEIRDPPKRLHRRDNQPWYDLLAQQGWLAPGWPVEHGGLGLSVGKQLILLEETDAYGCARLNDMGIAMVGPLLIRYGSEEQKRFFLPRILSGEHIWCQGYSEPGAGSDLASLRTEAVEDGDHWVVNGQKTWATLANDANWIFMLVRTDKTAKKQEGITFLVAPMDTPGITVRPMLTLDLHDEFSEIFFDNVRVPKGNTVGCVNEGWSVAKALLGFERILLGSPKQAQTALAKLRKAGEFTGVSEDPDFIERYTALALDLEDHRSLYQHYADLVRCGQMPGPDVSLLKVHQTELYQRITDAILEYSGEHAAALESPAGFGGVSPASAFLQARPSTIYGGSNEIQRNILAKSVLELPS